MLLGASVSWLPNLCHHWCCKKHRMLPSQAPQELPQETIMRPSTTTLIAILALGLFLGPRAAEAQQAGKMPRIGVMGEFFWPPFDAFRAGLRELGYVEGENIVVEYRWSEGQTERFLAFVAEFIRHNADVIVVWGT